MSGLGKDEPAAPKGGPVLGDAITVTSLDAPALTTPSVQTVPPASAQAAATVPVAGPQSAPPPEPVAAPEPGAAAPTETAPEPPPAPKSAMQLACEAKGGKWGKAGATTAMTCFKPTRDAGKSCRRESDCSTLCLARSRSCAPVTPLFGCHPVLQNDGREVTLCTD